jgi:molybdenum cofactor cytidylyltransferase
VLLGAGRSVRMGRPKLLLPWGQTTVIGHSVGLWRSLGARQIAVVGAAGARFLEAELNRLDFPWSDRIWNHNPRRGMFSSVQCAARWNGWQDSLTHWAIVLGDQPHVCRETLRRVLDFSAAHPSSICLPRQGGHRRHPVLLPKTAFRKLGNSTAQNLRSFLDLPQVTVLGCELDDPALGFDLDRPKDYRKGLKMFFGCIAQPIPGRIRRKKRVEPKASDAITGQGRI